MHNVWIVAMLVFILNLPFGFWRSGSKKFSRKWFMAVHFPIPFTIALRILAGIGWQFSTFPILVAAFFSGQFLGGKLRYNGRSLP